MNPLTLEAPSGLAGMKIWREVFWGPGRSPREHSSGDGWCNCGARDSWGPCARPRRSARTHVRPWHAPVSARELGGGRVCTCVRAKGGACPAIRPAAPSPTRLQGHIQHCTAQNTSGPSRHPPEGNDTHATNLVKLGGRRVISLWERGKGEEGVSKRGHISPYVRCCSSCRAAPRRRDVAAARGRTRGPCPAPAAEWTEVPGIPATACRPLARAGLPRARPEADP